ncbi:MAG TPA: response regulator [Saprospiraceae bacterium]|nr:response regulator [Saprospiraceae bacterium]
MQAVIIDDEKDSHLTLGDKLKRQQPDIEIVAAAYNVEEGREIILRHQPQLVFLDIDMPDGTGLDLVRSLPERNFHLIFVTGHNQYAQTAIRLGALDYLLKPVDDLELGQAILRAKQAQLQQIQIEQLEIMQQTLQLLRQQQLPERMSIATNEGVLYFPTEKVIHLQAMQNFTEFHVAEQEQRLIASHHLKKYETDLQPYPTFMRIHKSHLINLRRVIRLIKGDKSYVELSNGKIVPVSRKHRSHLEKALERMNI